MQATQLACLFGGTMKGVRLGAVISFTAGSMFVVCVVLTHLGFADWFVGTMLLVILIAGIGLIVGTRLIKSQQDQLQSSSPLSRRAAILTPEEQIARQEEQTQTIASYLHRAGRSRFYWPG